MLNEIEETNTRAKALSKLISKRKKEILILKI